MTYNSVNVAILHPLERIGACLVLGFSMSAFSFWSDLCHRRTSDCASPNWSCYCWPSNSSRRTVWTRKSPSIRAAPRYRPTRKDSSSLSQPTKLKGFEFELLHRLASWLIYWWIICHFPSSPPPSRAWFYCKACHEDVKDETLIKKCKCKNCELTFISSHPSCLSVCRSVSDKDKQTNSRDTPPPPPTPPPPDVI